MAQRLHLSPPSRRTLFMLCVLLSVASATAIAGIESIQVLPPNPSERDTIQVTVAGYLPNSCWHLDGSSTASLPETLVVNCFTSDSTYVRCFDVITPYSVVGRFGPLPAGQYVVAVTEYHDSIHQPLPDEAFATFDVAPFSPIRSTRWGLLKALFR